MCVLFIGFFVMVLVVMGLLFYIYLLCYVEVNLGFSLLIVGVILFGICVLDFV